MAKRYIVLGAGLQGQAIAYALARWGNAESVLIADANEALAAKGAERVNTLIGGSLVQSAKADCTNRASTLELLRGQDACCSAVPYYLNAKLAEWAVEAGVHFNDLGGNTGVTWDVHKLDAAAKTKGVSLVPDSGLMPGLGNQLAALLLQRVPTAKHVRIYCGGIPERPVGPLGYRLVFSVEGLINEYFGQAWIVRKGEVAEVPTFGELETLAQPCGRPETFEAFTTTGGSSTAPWTFAGKIDSYEYKTLRYPGHWMQFNTFKELGFLEEEPVLFEGREIVPRAFFRQLVTPRIDFPDVPDLVLLVVRVFTGDPAGPPAAEMQLLDKQDPVTGFTAMQRMTGFPAALVTILAAEGKLRPGSLRLERDLDQELFVERLRRMDIEV